MHSQRITCGHDVANLAIGKKKQMSECVAHTVCDTLSLIEMREHMPVESVTLLLNVLFSYPIRRSPDLGTRGVPKFVNTNYKVNSNIIIRMYCIDLPTSRSAGTGSA